MQKRYHFHYDFLCKKVRFTTILRVKECHFHYDMQKINSCYYLHLICHGQVYEMQ
jgi:hypothetical protein